MSRLRLATLFAAALPGLCGCTTVGFETPDTGTESERGEALISASWDRYGINEFYRRPQRISDLRLLWLPSQAWNEMTRDQRQLVTRYIEADRSGAAGIGFGRVIDDGDITADKTVRQPALPGFCGQEVDTDYPSVDSDPSKRWSQLGGATGRKT